MHKYFLVIPSLLILACGKTQSDSVAVLQPHTAPVFVQQEECNCPHNQVTLTITGVEPDTIFKLTNGVNIALCGYRNESKPLSWSEFVLAECGQDTILSDWDATITAQIKVIKDTLLVEQIWNLPTGKNFEYKPTVYLIDQIYKEGNKTIVSSLANEDIQKYTPAEIQQVLEEYKALNDESQDDTMEMANKLFIAAISGSKKAHEYFIDFDNKFMLDGAFAEEYKDLAAVLKFYID